MTIEQKEINSLKARLQYEQRMRNLSVANNNLGEKLNEKAQILQGQKTRFGCLSFTLPILTGIATYFFSKKDRKLAISAAVFTSVGTLVSGIQRIRGLDSDRKLLDNEVRKAFEEARRAETTIEESSEINFPIVYRK